MKKKINNPAEVARRLLLMPKRERIAAYRASVFGRSGAAKVKAILSSASGQRRAVRP